jgi:hypothetical protein
MQNHIPAETGGTVGIARLPDQLVTPDVYVKPRKSEGFPAPDAFTVSPDIVTTP